MWRTMLQEIVVGESLTENWREQAAFICKTCWDIENIIQLFYIQK